MLRSGIRWTLPALIIGLCFLSARSVQAWSHDGHRLVTEFSLIDVVEQYGLDQPVEVVPLERFLKKFYHEASKSDRFRSRILEGRKFDPADQSWLRHYLLINQDVAIDYFEPGERVGEKVKPIDILIWHSTDPDDGRDRNLDIRSYQKIFGGTTGPSSQAFRHMEKPPFLIVNWRSTIGLPLRRAGEATQRAHLYFDLARIAKELNEPYWMWRFLACSFHYIQDLAQPYHTTEISSNGVIWNRANELQDRPDNDKSFREILANLITNSHHWFESYTSELIKRARKDYLAGKTDGIRPEVGMMFVTLRGASVDMKQGSIHKYSRQIRNISNKRAPDLLESVFYISDERLRGFYEYNQDLGYEVKPLQFVNPVKDDQFKKHEKRFFKLVYHSYELAGEAQRTAVDELMVPREPRTLRRLVWEIMRLR